MDDGEGGDHLDQFHRNEAISAVADDAFLGEEDDDYEDLYNDVNVGEGFLQSLRKNEDLGFPNQDSSNNNNTVEKKIESDALIAPNPSTSVPGESSVSRVSGYERSDAGQKGPATGSGGLRVELGPSSVKSSEIEQPTGSNNANVVSNSNVNNLSGQGIIGQLSHGGVIATTGTMGNVPNENIVRNVNGGNVVGNGTGIVAVATGGAVGSGGGGTILFVGDLHWWTTDAELEVELCKYGVVKEVKFFDEKASGKSKGFCQVEFYDPAAAAACKEGMNGHVFNGRPCVVAFASPFSVKRMGEAQVNRNQQMSQTALSQPRRGNNEGGRPGPPGAATTGAGSAIATGGNYQSGDANRGYGRANWRGNGQPMGGRGPLGPMRNRAGPMGGRGIIANSGNGFGPTPPLLHPNSMMAQGFDPAFGGPMGRMGSYPGFPGGPTPPFSGILSSFPPVGGVGLPGVAPHVNPAFFGRGMPMTGMGMMQPSAVDGPNMGMWSDPSMGGWVGEEHGGGRAGESSYPEEATSDHQYGEVSHDRGAWQNTVKEKDRTSERDWSGSSDRKYRDDRETTGYDRDIPREKDSGGHDHDWSDRRHRDDRDVGREREREREGDRERSRDRERERERDRDRDRDRDRYREERDRYSDHRRYRDREVEHDDDWDRGRSSRTHNKSRLSQEEEHRSRSRDADYGKRRRLTSE
ncbi:RNA-binding (RRM/RBD/RNP motifs) family protein [Euphorbia peplus]|nr:RNA-binding (RRM/RBD/RNP motifs) family protein [Euphorbia peplus]